ncbi:MAG TPA: VOC family protein [Terriglobales bacterium]|nr:VOC family protein [Terriglobales bacterium]
MKLLAALLVVISTISFAEELKRPAITGIALVRILAKDVNASHKFYTERLRLPEVPCVIKDCRQYQVGKDQYVQVIKADGRNNGMEVIGFKTADAEGLRRYLEVKKISVPKTVQKNSDGSQEFEITDAEGHRVVFLQPGKLSDKRGDISHRMIHVGFVVNDRGVMDRLYREILGFRPYWYGGWTEDHPIWVSSQVPEGTDWMEYMLDVKPNADHHLLGIMNHYSLGIADINDAAKGLAKSGWEPTKAEHTQLGRDGKRQLNVWDPDDVRIEFMEFTPAEKPCCSEFTGPHPTAD